MILTIRKRIAKRKINEKRNIETSVISTVMPELSCPDQNLIEVSGERDPREVMNERLDRAELSS